VLLACPAPHKIREKTLEKFVSLVREVFRGRRLKLRKLRELHRLAQESIGIPVENQPLALEGSVQKLGGGLTPTAPLA